MKHRVRLFDLAAILLLPMAAMMCGCRQQNSTSQTATSTAVTSYDLRGKVVSVDVQDGMVTVDHEAVPGFMDAMTMTYRLKDANVATELHPGDHITAKLLVGKDDEDVMLDQIVITSQAKPDYKPIASYHVPQPGETVPDFSFLNQNGRTRHMHDYSGRVVLITFIYTRCPLSDFCVRMSRNFAEIDKTLSADATLYSRTHLLSVSFDPAYDTPAVLRSYGGAYTGRYTKETFAHWEFAAIPKQELDKVEEYFDLGVTPEKDHTLSHSLSTMVVGRDGKVVAWYPTNDWSPNDVVSVIRKAAATK
jgi:protein SCO1/2